MIGFIFKGRHSSEFNIGFKSVDRTAIPERRKKEFTILGRSGTLELESTEYEKRYITAVIGVMYIDKFNDLRTKIRDLAGWLSGSGLLIFDDEPDKAYEASVYSAVGVEQLAHNQDKRALHNEGAQAVGLEGVPPVGVPANGLDGPPQEHDEHDGRGDDLD